MKDIEGYAGLYAVTEDGQVWSYPNRLHTGKWMKQPLRNGYPCVDLCFGASRATHHVHRLVAQAFLPNPDGYPQVNHKNSVKTDSRVENLEWCTASHNKQHSWDNGTTIVTERKREASRRNAYKMGIANRRAA